MDRWFQVIYKGHMETTGFNYYYQERLRSELVERIDRNPRYSLRSFAAALGLEPSALSQILAGKRSVSTKLVDRIFTYLEFSIAEQRQFLESLIAEKNDLGLKRISPELSLRLRKLMAAPTEPVKDIGMDEFRVIADWYHYAILEMTFSKKMNSDPRWIAKELNISITEAKLAIDRMLELELLEKLPNGELKKTNLNIETRDKTKTSLFHRRRQRQILEKSIHSLEHDPIEERMHSSFTLCIDPRKVLESKTKIQTVMWNLAQDLLTDQPERVYELTVNFFPLQNKTACKTQKTGEVK